MTVARALSSPPVFHAADDPLTHAVLTLLDQFPDRQGSLTDLQPHLPDTDPEALQQHLDHLTSTFVVRRLSGGRYQRYAAAAAQLTPAVTEELLTGLDAAPGGEGGPVAMHRGLSNPEIGIKLVESWVPALLERGLIREVRNTKGRAVYARFDLDSLIDAAAVNLELAPVLEAALHGQPAMTSAIASRLDLDPHTVQATLLYLWRDGRVTGRPVAAGFVFRLPEDHPLTAQEAAQHLTTWAVPAAEPVPAPHSALTAPEVQARKVRIKEDSLAGQLLRECQEPRRFRDLESSSGVKGSTLSSALARLTRQGLLDRLGSGQYQATPLAHQFLKQPRTPRPRYLSMHIPPVPAKEGKGGFTPEQQAWLRTYFPRLGGVACSVLLQCSSDSVYRFSREESLTYGDVPGYIRTSELAALLQVTTSTVSKRALAYGMLVMSGHPTIAGCQGVPMVETAWADTISNERQPATPDDVLVEEVFKLFDLTETRVRELIGNRGYSRLDPSGRRRFYVSRETFADLQREAAVRAAQTKPERRPHLILPLLLKAGETGVRPQELAEPCGYTRGHLVKHLNELHEAGEVDRYRDPGLNVISYIYRHPAFRNAPPPQRVQREASPADLILERIRTAGPGGITAHGLLSQGGLHHTTFDTHLRKLTQRRAVQVIGAQDWNHASIYRAAEHARAPRPVPPIRTPPQDGVTLVAEALEQAGVAGLQLGDLCTMFEQSPSEVERALRALKSRGELLITLENAGGPTKQRRYHLQTPDCPAPPLPTPPPEDLPMPEATLPDPAQTVLLPCPVPSPAQVTTLPATAQLSLQDLLGTLEARRARARVIEERLAKIDQERRSLQAELDRERPALQALIGIEQHVIAFLQSEGARTSADQLLATFTNLSSASDAAPPAPELVTPAPPTAARATEVESERRRAPTFPVPVPDGLSTDGLSIFKLVRQEKSGLPFKQICARLNFSTQRASKALEELTGAGHMKQAGSHYRCVNQPQ